MRFAHLARLHLGRERSWHLALAGAGCCFLALAILMLVKLYSASGQIKDLRASQTKLSSALTDAEALLRAHDIQPVPPPPAQLIGPAGPPGPAGPGPSDVQVQAAVASYLAAHPIAGQPPPA
ncbi:MAG: hypothetical protein HOV97_19450, partial [Nonomuraea sp.]|nr:hypothetical protein [Nonomuraea sp.]